ncbi:MAG: sigma 54-interacting transcriptional regulator [Candidatus Aureabacteria bacterium]|nr:sigma 54-interacting transcriptional regulator [Candidatus Auribacterota bacterium]
MNISKKKPPVKREIKELSLLLEISQILDNSPDIRDSVGNVLKAMAKHMGMIRGTLTLLNRQSGEISIEAAYGLSSSERVKGKYKLGEGITGKVVASGKPAVVPRISEEPLFLDKTGARKKLTKKDISFICIPIKIGKEVIGSLSVDRLFSDNISFEEDIRLLTILASMVAQAVKLRQTAQEEKNYLLEENLRLQQKLKDKFSFSNIIGSSAAMNDVYTLIAQVSKSNASVLILGESGTGKELVASAIHYNSLRAKKPFVKVSCAALSESILESEIFGHEKGAFTGAATQRKGRFELANKGTIFLDEIGDIPLSTQIKLLRVLQEKEFERVGGTQSIKIDVRVIAATNRNLEKLIKEGRFREDLYYRLHVFPINIPPLRERKTDILLLANYFIGKYSKENQKNIRRISTPAIDMLMSYHWPGNVRELENGIERAVLLSNDDVIHGHHLPPTLQTAEASGTVFRGNLQETLDKIERELIQETLKTAHGNRAKAARALGISERLMGLRVKKHNIDVQKYHSNW